MQTDIQFLATVWIASSIIVALALLVLGLTEAMKPTLLNVIGVLAFAPFIPVITFFIIIRSLI